MPGDGDELLCQEADVFGEGAGLVVVSDGDGPEDPIDGVVGGQGAVVDDKVPLQPLRDVVSTPARLDHGRQVVHVHDVAEVSGLLQTAMGCVIGLVNISKVPFSIA